MEIRSLKSPSTLNALPTFPIRRDSIASGFSDTRFFTFYEPRYKTLATASKLKIVTALSGASGESRSVSVEAGCGDTYENDDGVVFVAGATGRVGSRTVRELLKIGFSVRAGVRTKQKAEALVESVQKIQDASSTLKLVERLELVECDLEKPETIGPALGNAAVVICCIGASEKEVFDISGPYRIDYLATKNLVDAAAVAKVKHFIMVSSLGTNKIGFPAGILNLFWGVLLWKRKAEEALIASGIPYTIVRPGGMERPTDAYKETHNITLSEEDTLFGGQVSNLQVAELMAFMAKNRRLSYCKVVEVIAKTSAPLRPIDELLLKIPYQRVPPKELDVSIGTTPQQPKESRPELARDLEVAGVATTLDSSRESQSESVQASPGLPDSSATDVATVESVATDDQTSISRPLSPYTAYEDLKPPSSPSPIPTVKDITETSLQQTSTDLSANASTTEQASPSLGNGSSIAGQDASEQEPPLISAANPLPSRQPAQEVPVSKPKLSPLSPFTMYEDLKPPSSPIPTPGKM